MTGSPLLPQAIVCTACARTVAERLPGGDVVVTHAGRTVYVWGGNGAATCGRPLPGTHKRCTAVTPLVETPVRVDTAGRQP